ncbi:hypothetical protein [Stenotrophomonas indicatrix]|uniref:hypothetical protein n=1 Tax=Stenotrophomonas indicatrix TaxID=2045451 RepID=UPI00341F3FCB
MLSVGQKVDGAAAAGCGHRLPAHNSAMAIQEQNQEKRACERARGVSTRSADD